jgi:protein-L-isoaspartate O-methyltransferase
VVKDKFVLRITHPEAQLAAVAPLLCAGITTYSPLREWKVGPGSKVGIVGLGGLGHMGVKLAAAMGAHVVLFTTSPNKAEDAKRLGAAEVVVTKNPAEMKPHRNSLDFILNTVAASHSMDMFLTLLKRDGTMVLVGAPPTPHASPGAFNLIFKRRRLAGSLIGGIAETQEMLDFCAAARHRLRHRDHPHARHQRRLRAHAEERREVPLRHRHEHAHASIGSVRSASVCTAPSRFGPAAASDDAKTNRRGRNDCRSIASTTSFTASKLIAAYSASFSPAMTAARWITTSTSGRTSEGSRKRPRSPRSTSMRPRRSASSLSGLRTRPTTVWPSASKRRVRWLPMKPVHPVTKRRMARGP